MRLRAIEPGDRDALERALRSDGTFRQDEIVVALELIDSAIKSDVDYVVIVAVDDPDAVLGYICYGRTPMTRATIDLYWIVVDAAARGRGVAVALVSAMEAAALAEAQARGELAIGVRVETSPADGHGAARRLYDKLGYPIASELADFYAPGESLITY
ncbi:MAG: GNAT family N-acetyltransferase [Proteobacteria bacterium]|nr:GNAT family N-acetyltransferase [Pseudomonadota bacterium]